MNVFIGFFISVALVFLLFTVAGMGGSRACGPAKNSSPEQASAMCLKNDLLREAYKSYALATRERDPMLFFQHIQNASAYMEMVRKKGPLRGLGTDIIPSSVGDAEDLYTLIKRIKDRLTSAS